MGPTSDPTPRFSNLWFLGSIDRQESFVLQNRYVTLLLFFLIVSPVFELHGDVPFSRAYNRDSPFVMRVETFVSPLIPGEIILRVQKLDRPSNLPQNALRAARPQGLILSLAFLGIPKSRWGPLGTFPPPFFHRL